MSYRAFDVCRIAGALGAELAGVDLSELLDDAVIAEIRRALLDHQGSHAVARFREMPPVASDEVIRLRRLRALQKFRITRID